MNTTSAKEDMDAGSEPGDANVPVREAEECATAEANASSSKQATPKTPNHSLNRPAETQPQIDELRRQLEELGTRVEKESKGAMAKVKSLGLVLGVLGAVFSIPKGAVELYNMGFGRAKFEIGHPSELTMTYDAKTTTLMISFEAIIWNRGNKSGVVTQTEAEVQSVNNQTAITTFHDSDISFKENNEVVPKSLPIAADKYRALTIVIETYLTPTQIAALSQQDDTRRRFMARVFADSGGPSEFSAQFDIGSYVATNLFHGSQTSELRFNLNH